MRDVGHIDAALADGWVFLPGDRWIAESRGIQRIAGVVNRQNQPAISDASGNAWRPFIEHDGSQLVIWYTMQEHGRTTLLRRISEDGRSWSTPPTPVFQVKGWVASVFSSGPPDMEPVSRYKMLLYLIDRPGLSLAFSDDGVQWHLHPSNPILPALPPGSPDQRWLQGPSDIMDVVWDQRRGIYHLIHKMFSGPGNGLQGRTNKPGWGVRLLGYARSPDLLSWSRGGRTFAPDSMDSGVTEFYGMTMRSHQGGFVGFLRVLRDDLPCEPGGDPAGIGYTVLATSEDGVDWKRQRTPFLDRASVPGAFDRGHAWVTGTAGAAGSLHLAYSAYDQGHKIGRRQVGMATVDLDRLLGIRFAPGGGYLRSAPISMCNNSPPFIRVNADARGGRIAIRLMHRPEPLASFSADQRSACVALGHVRPPFVIEIEANDATLWGLQIVSSHQANKTG